MLLQIDGHYGDFLTHEKGSDSTQYSLYRYIALNMKRVHTQAGRLASTRGNYCTAQRYIALLTMKGAALQSPRLDVFARIYRCCSKQLGPESRKYPGSHTPHCNKKRLRALRVTAWPRTAGSTRTLSRYPYSHQSRHKAYIQPYQMSV
jgi:hypothetical protein